MTGRTADMRIERVRLGGAAALAIAALDVARLAVVVAVSAATIAGGGPTAVHGLALAAVALAGAGATALVVRGVREAFGGGTALLRILPWIGWAAAALLLAQGGWLGWRALTAPAEVLRQGLVLGYLAGFAGLLWIAGVSAADWRARRLPAFLRVVGVVLVVAGLVGAVVPIAQLVALPCDLVWWVGLGVALTTLRRSTSD